MSRPQAPKVGVLVELTRQFGRDLCQGISSFANETDAFTPAFVTPDVLRRKSELRTFDGFIARVMNDEIAEALGALGKPVVDVYYEKPRLGFAIVKTNHSRVGRLAAEHFISRRFTNFAFCGSAGGRFSTYCLLAFRRALKARGFDCRFYQPNSTAQYKFDNSVLINEKLNRASDAKSLARWAKSLPKPIAVFCPNDLRAWQLLHVCRENGIDVPHDVALLGLDNDAIVCGFSNPAISSIDPDTPAIGRMAARTVVEMMADPDFRKTTLIRQVPPNAVVTRASSEVFPLDPAWLSDALVFMRKHVADRLSASDVFRYLGLSHTVVDATFRKVLKTTVQKEVGLARMEEAQRLLENSPLSSSQIAERCGFASASYFVKTFAEANGLTPLDWRKAAARNA